MDWLTQECGHGRDPRNVTNGVGYTSPHIWEISLGMESRILEMAANSVGGKEQEGVKISEESSKSLSSA